VNTFDIWHWQPPGWSEPHPVVIVSHPSRASKKPVVEMLVCSTKRAGREAEPHEIILDQADGMDWPTLCRCDLIYAAERNQVSKFKGRVSETRRGQLVRTMIAAHGWAAVL